MKRKISSNKEAVIGMIITLLTIAIFFVCIYSQTIKTPLSNSLTLPGLIPYMINITGIIFSFLWFKTFCFKLHRKNQ